jgi:ppGpp synthetase/RelA/SpoT-type nucleotidyltranferase
MSVEPPTYEEFLSRSVVESLLTTYDRSLPLFRIAVVRLYTTLSNLNRTNGWFTTIGGRLKSKGSIFEKLYDRLKNSGSSEWSDDMVRGEYQNILDLGGVRAATRYIDEVQFVAGQMRRALTDYGYVGDMTQDTRYRDQNYLRDPDPDTGYRAFHVFVGVPINFFVPDHVEPIPCEVQIRTDLQDIWAERSHQLIYKRHSRVPRIFFDSLVNISATLAAADDFLKAIRDRIKEGK